MHARSPRTRRLALGLVLAAFASACTSSSEVGGIWRSASAVPGPLVGGPSDVFVEVSLGHYGPDVAGLVRFFHDPDFEDPLDAAAPYRECACAFVHRGRWLSAASVLDFQLRGCLPGASPQAPLLVRAELTLDGDLLDGILRVEEPTSPLFGTEQPLQLERFGSIGAADLQCEPPDSAEAGNLASGR